MQTYTEGLPSPRAARMPPKTKGKGRKTGAQKKKKKSSPGESQGVSVTQRSSEGIQPSGQQMEWVCFGFVFCSFDTGSLWDPGCPSLHSDRITGVATTLG